MFANAGYATAAVLSSTGVLLPLGGALIGALLIANKLANMYIQNKKLYPIMFDAMNILSSVYRLNDLILKIYKVFLIYIFNNPGWLSVKSPDDLNDAHLEELYAVAKATRASVLTNKQGILIEVGGQPKKIEAGDILLQIGINQETQKHVIEKTNSLISNLLQTADTALLESLKADEDIDKANFQKVIQQELDKRNVTVLETSTGKKGIFTTMVNGAKTAVNTVANSAAKKMGSMSRTMNRAFYAFYIKQDIVDNLSMIQSYTLDLKVQFDFMLDMYEREFTADWKKCWKQIERLHEFKEYAVPRDTVAMIRDAVAQGEITVAVVEGAAKTVAETPDAVAAAAEKEDEQTNQSKETTNPVNQSNATN